MKTKLNEFIDIYKKRKEIELSDFLSNLKQDLVGESLHEILKIKISCAERTIRNWMKIIGENISRNPPMVFTGDIGSKFYISIFDALITEEVFDYGFSSKNINSEVDNHIHAVILKTLNEMLNVINEYKCGMGNFEKLIITLRDKCNIIGAI